MSAATVLFAMGAGVVSFLSPCMLPVVPAFLAQLGGTTFEDGVPRRRELLGNAGAFVVGFALSFAVLGIAVSALLAGRATAVTRWSSRVAGVVIVAMGLHLTGLLRVGVFERRYRVSDRLELDGSVPMAFGFGAAFGVGWTPCVGPLLGSAFALASASPGDALPILLAYGLGAGLPFLLVAAVPGPALDALDRHRGTTRLLHRAFGVALLVLGVLVFAGRLAALGGLPLLEALV